MTLLILNSQAVALILDQSSIALDETPKTPAKKTLLLFNSLHILLKSQISFELEHSIA